MFLASLDRVENVSSFISELGCELINLRDNLSSSLNPNRVKEIIVEVENIRIAKRLSELTFINKNENDICREREKVLRQRYDFFEGQQCVRDF